MLGNYKFEHSLQALAIYLVWISACFDPVGRVYGLRYFALLFSALVLAVLFVRRGFPVRRKVYWLYFILFVFVLPCWGTVVAALKGGFDEDLIDTSCYAAAIYFTITLLYGGSAGVQLGFRAMLFSLRALAILIVLCFLCFYFDIFSEPLWLIPEFGLSYFGTRNYGGVETYYIYFVASPMLVFYVSYSSYRYVVSKFSVINIMDIIIGSFALFLSGTRINMLMSVTIFPVIYVYRRFGILVLLALLLLSFSLSFYFNMEGGVLGAAIDPSDESNALKLTYLNLYGKVFSDYSTVFFGQGFNAHVWFSAFYEVLPEGASKIELTYIEIYRVFGLMLGTVVVAMLVYIIFIRRHSAKRHDWIRAAVLFYLFVTFLNPYLFSSNGMLVLGLAISALSAYKVSPCLSQQVSI